MEVTTLEAVRALVHKGIGVSVMPYIAVAHDLSSRRLCTARVENITMTRYFNVVYHKHRPLLTVARLFLEYLRGLRGANELLSLHRTLGSSGTAPIAAQHQDRCVPAPSYVRPPWCVRRALRLRHRWIRKASGSFEPRPTTGGPADEEPK